MNHSVRSLFTLFTTDRDLFHSRWIFPEQLPGMGRLSFRRSRVYLYPNPGKSIWQNDPPHYFVFCIPGLISIWANGSVLSQLQPAIIETALCLLLGFFAFSHTDFTHTLPAGYRKNIHLSGPQLQSMRKMLRIASLSLSPYIPLLAYTAILFLPEDTAKIHHNPLLYIILGTYFVVLFIHNRLLLRKMKKKNGCPSSTKRRSYRPGPPAFVIRDPNYSIPSYIFTLPTIATNYSCKRSMKKTFCPVCGIPR